MLRQRLTDKLFALGPVWCQRTPTGSVQSDLARVYRQLAGMLHPGGVLLNGDLLPLPGHLPRIQAALEAVDERRQSAALARGSDAWQQWWDTLHDEPELRETFAERERVWPTGTAPVSGPSVWPFTRQHCSRPASPKSGWCGRISKSGC